MRTTPTKAEEEAFLAMLRNPNVDWRVADVRSLPEYRLWVRFRDGLEGMVYMREQIFAKDAGVFMSLRDPHAFAQVSVKHGAVVWANGLDIAPDATYFDISRYGEQVLR